MLLITPTFYQRLGDLLVEAIDSTDYYSGDIELGDLEVDYRFSSTLMIYYAEEIYPEGCQTIICDIVPVWWELHTFTEDGEWLNDFDFNTLKAYVCRI